MTAPNYVFPSDPITGAPEAYPVARLVLGDGTVCRLFFGPQGPVLVIPAHSTHIIAHEVGPTLLLSQLPQVTHER